jgi:hypothetical protein
MPSPRHTGHPVVLAPGPGQAPLDASPPPTRPTVEVARAATPDLADGGGEPDLGYRRIHGELAQLGCRVRRAPCGCCSNVPASIRRRAAQT